MVQSQALSRGSAQEGLTLAYARYQVQLGSFLDVLIAEAAATNAETNYVPTALEEFMNRVRG